MHVVIRTTRVLVVSLSLAGCAATGPEGALIADPFESANRSVHAFNKGLDKGFLKPTAEVYDLVTPTLLRHIFGNALSNLELPGIFVNQLLQGEATAAVTTLGRFTVNTIYGAAGALDPATELGLPKTSTDFGLTMARWGIDEGVYVELPLFGPSTARDTVGLIVDAALRPTSYLGGGTDAAIASATVRAVEIVDRRARNAGLIDDLLYHSEDSYVSLRASYIQNRRRKAHGGKTDIDALPDLFSE